MSGLVYERTKNTPATVAEEKEKRLIKEQKGVTKGKERKEGRNEGGKKRGRKIEKEG